MRVLLPALLTFAAGAVFGFLFGRGTTVAPAALLEPDLAAYEQGIGAALGLDAAQREELHVLLAYYARERSRVLDASRGQLEPELSDLDRRFEQLIRSRILRPEQRKRAEELEMPQPVLSAGGGPR